jgi:hypothetical protein
LVLVFSGVVGAKEWRGIVPLKSTREDVVRLLGSPTQQTEASYYYRLAEELAVIWFQPQPCDQCGLGWKVPVGTVTTIGVIPRSAGGKRKPANLDGFKVQAENAGFVYYVHESSGLTIETFNEQVTSLNYAPEAKDASLECVLKDCIVDVFPNFDAYANLAWSDEKARLDNYAIRLNDGMLRGAIVIYARDQQIRSRLIKRAVRARNYLKKRDIEPERILVVDGGYDLNPHVELEIYSIGGFGSQINLFPQKEPPKPARRDAKQKR